jgi:hypothetical protein
MSAEGLEYLVSMKSESGIKKSAKQSERRTERAELYNGWTCRLPLGGRPASHGRVIGHVLADATA